MKNCLFMIITFILATSCSYEEDIFETYKDAPFLLFSYKGQNLKGITDSLKIPSEQIGNKEILFDLKINDKSNALQVRYELDLGQGILQIGNEVLDKEFSNKISRGTHNCKYIPQRTGQHKLTLNLIDLYGNATAKEASFYVFSNLPPKAQFEIRNISQYSKYEIEIDASKSWDQDEKWGGQISEYIFKIGSYYEFTTTEFSSIKHILPGPGTYVISLQVRDNDQAISKPVFQEISF